jgi:ATP-dependent 26S proteasome regulatory subunit
MNNYYIFTICPNNVIFIATTNYYDKLDKALIRDGRFDLKLELKELEKKDLPRYMNYLKFDGTVDEVIEAYGENDGTFNQSKLQNTIISLRG